MTMTEYQERALLGFDPRELSPFLVGGKPRPYMLQILKQKGLCIRNYYLSKAAHRWELTALGRKELKRIRLAQGLPEYPDDPNYGP